MANLYNQDNYYNPHNVVGVDGLAKAHVYKDVKNIKGEMGYAESYY